MKSGFANKMFYLGEYTPPNIEAPTLVSITERGLVEYFDENMNSIKIVDIYNVWPDFNATFLTPYWGFQSDSVGNTYYAYDPGLDVYATYVRSLNPNGQVRWTVSLNGKRCIKMVSFDEKCYLLMDTNEIIVVNPTGSQQLITINELFDIHSVSVYQDFLVIDGDKFIFKYFVDYINNQNAQGIAMVDSNGNTLYKVETNDMIYNIDFKYNNFYFESESGVYDEVFVTPFPYTNQYTVNNINGFSGMVYDGFYHLETRNGDPALDNDKECLVKYDLAGNELFTIEPDINIHGTKYMNFIYYKVSQDEIKYLVYRIEGVNNEEHMKVFDKNNNQIFDSKTDFPYGSLVDQDFYYYFSVVN